MKKPERISRFTILVAEDDPDDRFLIKEVFREIGDDAELHFVENGEELMHYLLRVGKYADTTLFPLPMFILLDLNMPKKDGRRALVEIKSNPHLEKIPVAVWTTSKEEQDKIFCKDAGADIYITKPYGFSEWVDNIRKIVMKYTSK